MAWKAVSTPKKKKARMVVMITTIIAVATVSLRVGQTILADSARTWRRKSVGLTLATSAQILFGAAAGDRGAGQPSFCRCMRAGGDSVGRGGRQGRRGGRGSQIVF